MNLELIGLFASILILISACCNTQKKMGIILLRALNMLGSIIYVYYGYVLHSYSLMFLNLFMVIINGVYFYTHVKNYS